MSSGRPDWSTITSPIKSIYGEYEEFWFHYDGVLLMDNNWHDAINFTVPADTIIHLGGIFLWMNQTTRTDFVLSIGASTLLYTTGYESKNINFDANTTPIANAGEAIELQTRNTNDPWCEVKCSIIGFKQEKAST